MAKPRRDTLVGVRLTDDEARRLRSLSESLRETESGALRFALKRVPDSVVYGSRKEKARA
jgi:hypothetical protein